MSNITLCVFIFQAAGLDLERFISSINGLDASYAVVKDYGCLYKFIWHPISKNDVILM